MASNLEQEVSQLFSYLDTQKDTNPPNPAFAVTDVDQLLEERPPPRPPLPEQYQPSATVVAVSQQPQRAQPVEGFTAPTESTGSESVEEEVDKLTDILMKNLEFAGEKDFYGICRKCDDKVIGAENGCHAMSKLYHRTCFICNVCKQELVNLPFYSLDNNPLCENDYIASLEKCVTCGDPIREMILKALNKVFHPKCFTCTVCNMGLDGVPFTVDTSNQVYCLNDFHNKFAPRCSACGEPIVPDKGSEETVRVIALDRSFHVNCYKCEDCGKLLSSEEAGRGCYPIDNHLYCLECNRKRLQSQQEPPVTDV
ncbi:thyroid receptor-interacting protein 6-like [Corticium candelabrum]|uniref:thyroid receptor-interacting protein 6-like n=1 Tax=Corticium candelabrum TaxID=121492 RepID=UPI002E274B49|nr:thyroid receptor-interacting protein 6-like [Corticium candelabrum]